MILTGPALSTIGFAGQLIGRKVVHDRVLIGVEMRNTQEDFVAMDGSDSWNAAICVLGSTRDADLREQQPGPRLHHSIALPTSTRGK